MSDDAKEWVTIKIPKTVRNQARDKPQTYGTIMEAGIAALEGDGDDYAPKADASMQNGPDLSTVPGLTPEQLEDALAETDFGAPVALSYDDVVAASRQALREELPGEALQG